ncbi:MAG: hypothetical protein Q8O75_00255 [bacterium]|nr:hypothetical protein [bacterium]
MAEDINLLPEVTEEQVKKAGGRRNVNVAAISSLLIVAAILLSLFGYELFLSSSAKRIESQTKAAEENIVSQSRKEITHRLLVGKIEAASQFLASELPYSEGYSQLIEIIKKSGCVLTESTFKSDGALTIIGEAKTSSNLETLINQLTGKEAAKIFDNARLVDLVWDNKNNFYKFTIDVKFLKKGIKPQISSNK